MRIAVDAMGGDNAPKAIVEGVMLAKKDFPEIEFLLYGKENEIKKYMTDDKNVTIIHTDEKINSDDEPVKAIRRKKTPQWSWQHKRSKMVRQMRFFQLETLGPY